MMTLEERAAEHHITSTRIPGHDKWLTVGYGVVSRTPDGVTGTEQILAVTSTWILSEGRQKHVVGKRIRYLTATGWRESADVVSIGEFMWKRSRSDR
jgi:hypothetical protein